MKTNAQLLTALLCMLGSQLAMGDPSMLRGRYSPSAPTIVDSQDRIRDGAATKNQLAGVFQRYEPGRNIVRISDVDYDLDPSLASLGSKLREFRFGQTVLFTLAGVSDAGRNVIKVIEPQ